MATRDEIYAAIRAADKAGDGEAVRKLGAYLQTMDAAPEPAAPEKSFGDKVKQGLGNLAAGAVRGAGSIGATLLAPIDIAKDALAGKGLSLESNRQRRADMDAGLQSLGAEPDSLLYKGGKLAGEIAGTAGAGGVLANGARAAGASPAFVNALQSAGMTTGQAVAPNALARMADLGTRAAAGGIVGGASAGLVNPEEAGTGAVVGAAFPLAMKAAGAAGNAIGRVARGPEQPADLAQAVQAAREAGYVIPPTQARPTVGNRLLEGFSGKITTAQNASAKNQAVTNSKIAEAIGLAPETKITPNVLDAVRKEAGAVYGEVASLPARPAVAADTLTNTPASQAIDPAAMVFDLRKARNDATAWFRSYGRTADPDALVKAKSAASQAQQLESTLEGYAASLGRDDLVPALREARQLIAKTYSIESALNPATGAVDARKLAGQLQKGKPLSGGLKEAAEFAARFPKAAQTVEQMGSLPQMSPLDWAAGGTLSAMSANPLMLASVMARPAARSLALSPVVQDRLIQGAGNPLSVLVNPQAAGLAYRAAPVIAADR